MCIYRQRVSNIVDKMSVLYMYIKRKSYCSFLIGFFGGNIKDGTYPHNIENTGGNVWYWNFSSMFYRQGIQKSI